MADDRVSFLYMSIQDIQGSIRAIDIKAGTALVILGLPITQASAMVEGVAKILAGSSGIWYWMLVAIVSVTTLTWFAASFFALWSLRPRHYGDCFHCSEPLSGSFYCGVVPMGAGLRWPWSKAKRIPLDDYVKGLPAAENAIIHELAFEQVKLASLRNVKARLVDWMCVCTVISALGGLASFLFWAAKR